MPWVGFEPTIAASERAKIVHALERGHCDRQLRAILTEISPLKYFSNILNFGKRFLNFILFPISDTETPKVYFYQQVVRNMWNGTLTDFVPLQMPYDTFRFNLSHRVQNNVKFLCLCTDLSKNNTFTFVYLHDDGPQGPKTYSSVLGKHK
jgi:hypothetical protein